MTNFSNGWGELGLSALVRNRFLVPSITVHLLLLYMAIGVKAVSPTQLDNIVPIQLLEIHSGGSPDKSIGPSRGAGGPRSMPKLGITARPRQQTGNLDKQPVEAINQSKQTEEPAPPQNIPSLPAPKVLASARTEPPAAKETSPDALVQLPTRQSSGSLSGGHLEGTQKNPAPVDSAVHGGDIRALKEGAPVPGALKGTGTGLGPYGVPGGNRSGTGLAGGGTGTGTGGGSATGLKGVSGADYNQYLKQIMKRVNSVWRYPDDVSGVQKVTVRFTLDRAGKLSQAEVLDSSDSRLNASAIEAMKRASPFPPIPESLKDLAGEPLIIRFNVEIRLKG